MDGEKLSQDLKCMIISWESKYERSQQTLGEADLKAHSEWNSEKAGQEEDTISSIIDGHIQEIEQEIQRINKEKEDKIKEEQERREREKKEQERKEQERKEQEKREREKKEHERREQEKKEQEKKEQEKKEQEKEPRTDLESFQARGEKYVEMVLSYQRSSEYKEIHSSTESSIKSTRMNVKKTIQLSINQISSTHQQIVSSSKKIRELLSELRSSSCTIASQGHLSPMYTYGLYMVASLFIEQCWTQISAFPDSVWSYAYSCINILDENEDFEAFLEGLIFSECRVLYSSNLEDLTQRENESEESFGKRLNSIVRFYLSINILRGNFGRIWLWFVKLLNRESPHRCFVFVVLAVIQITPHFFISQFKSQFMKIIDYILRFKMPQLYALIEGNPFPIKGKCKQLEAILSDLKSSSNAPPPSGFILKDKHLDVEC
ncbi:nuclear-export-signal-containing protein [Cryptosporidium canis]|uniref:mRNA export factor GLE1 n=1 Tax=Cryptosporidium canis TaxID=195482 RepID=A0A9D5HXX0_9CRYT|nr:nuclear-export-signal-containing protein [Cryptosporidium canis]